MSQPGSIMSEGEIRRRGKQQSMVTQTPVHGPLPIAAITPSSSTEFLGRPSWVTERIRLLWDFYPTPEKFEPVTFHLSQASV